MYVWKGKTCHMTEGHVILDREDRSCERFNRLRNQHGRKRRRKVSVGSSTPGKAGILKTSNRATSRDSECGYN